MFLGADGGGTNTMLCILAADGTELARVQAPSTYYLGRDITLVGEVLAEGVGQVCAAAGVRPADISHAFFGLPGYGEVSADLPVLDRLPAAALGHDRYACDNDMVCGWAGSLGAADGINVIAGTGSMTYGRRGARGVRVGGWGEIFGDEGSAYWVAVRGLSLFSRMSDGRAQPGPLMPLLRRTLALAEDLDLVDVVLNRWSGDRGRIAALSRAVAEAADAGDSGAARILTDAGAALVELVVATRERLGFDDRTTVPVSWSGGLLTADRVLNAFRAGLAVAGDYDLRRPLHDPCTGAALYAAHLAGVTLTPHREIA